MGGYSLPARLVRHGLHFDFMMVLEGENLATKELKDITSILEQEVAASRKLEKILMDKSKNGDQYRFIHKPMIFS